eukprot:TRINITY_DN16357_c0_g8_i1.p1 TRINITY_DN16357_c0_g8~~TRINITY_DN16357_c0_g8_i1.p1  ORF type:complete len:465 (-),score=57.64 TRINITY_DN16357_c0_g8_i1:140-1534(-)
MRLFLFLTSFNLVATHAYTSFLELAKDAVRFGCQGISPLTAPPMARRSCTKQQLDQLLQAGAALKGTDSSGDGLLALLRFFRAESLEDIHRAKTRLLKARMKDTEDFVSPGYVGLFEWFNNITAAQQIDAQRGYFVERKNAPVQLLHASKLLLEAVRRIEQDSKKRSWSSAAPQALLADRSWLRLVVNEGAKLQQYVGYPQRWDEIHTVGALVHVWKDRWQRPTQEFVEGLKAMPMWDVSQFPESYRRLERKDDFETVAKEVVTSLEKFLLTPAAKGDSPLQPTKGMPKVHAIEKFNRDGDRIARSGEWVTEDRGLHRSKSWYEMTLFSGGKRTKACRSLPKTCSLLEDALSEACRWKKGGLKLSAMGPGTEVLPHTGSSNSRLRLHFGIQVPAGATLRVADRNYTWHDGRVMIFDDSFEHAVWQLGDKYRIVLNADLPHPDLSKEQLKGQFVKRVTDFKKDEL